MKYSLLTCLGLGAMMSLAAQTQEKNGVIAVAPATSGGKMLTIEDAVLGYQLSPQNRYFQWQGDKHVLTYAEGTDLIGETADKGVKNILLTAGELGHIIGVDLKGWPSFGWKDGNTLTVRAQGKYYEIDINGKALKRSIQMPKQAANLTYNGTNAFAFTRNNNLYYSDEQGNEFAVTADEDKNIVNGQTVSRNEFGISNGIFWSPDGKKLAFYRKDEGQVGTFPLLDITSRTGSLREIKYPMAGMPSEQISLGIYDVASGRTVFMDVEDFGREQYLTNVTWSPESDAVYIQVLDRRQRNMHLNKYCARTGQFVKTLLKEENERFIEPRDKLVFLNNAPSRFIYRTDNRDGYRNLYVCDTDGKTVKRLAGVDADIEFIAEDGQYVYYTSAEVSPVENHLFRADLKTGKRERLTMAEGYHSINMSPGGKYFVDSYSSLNVPRGINLVQSDGKVVRELFRAGNPVKDYSFGEITLGTVKSADGQFDNYYRLIKPLDFDPSRKYPVVVYVYGGPQSQMVKNSWLAGMGRWEMYMAQRGYVVFVMDNRGTSNQGAAFEKAIYGQCGQAEMADQMKGIDFLRSQPWVDAGRIGVHGWSYGGFMTISLITNHPDVFKVGVAGGPVIDWKWYEVMYGERYMDSPNFNKDGYEKVSLLNKAKDLKGKLLICQGAVDNTVLWEHSLSFIRECIKNNVQVDYFPYPCAEHNVFGRDRIHLMQKVTNYFEDYLK